LGNASEVPHLHEDSDEDSDTQEPPGHTKYVALLDEEEKCPDVAPLRDDIDKHHSSFA